MLHESVRRSADAQAVIRTDAREDAPPLTGPPKEEDSWRGERLNDVGRPVFPPGQCVIFIIATRRDKSATDTNINGKEVPWRLCF